ncbi:MAG: hypothetical protein AAGE43_13855 [Pseudomonadota bacterium]
MGNAVARWVLTALCISCAGLGAAHSHARSYLEPYVGLYEGSFASALTPDPDDDLNFNPCNPATRDCSVHQDPHINILLSLELDKKNKPTVAFYRSASQLRSGRRLDLLGRGCSSSVGELQKLERGKRGEALKWTARFSLDVPNRACQGKLRPTSTHFILVRGLEDEETGLPFVEVAIDKSVASENYLFVKEDGVDRRVRIDLDNTRGSGRRAQYRVCVEDDAGDFTNCVLTDKEMKTFGLPVPVPGGAAVNVTFWQELNIKLKRTRGLYTLEQYTGRFERVD